MKYFAEEYVTAKYRFEIPEYLVVFLHSASVYYKTTVSVILWNWSTHNSHFHIKNKKTTLNKTDEGDTDLTVTVKKNLVSSNFGHKILHFHDLHHKHAKYKPLQNHGISLMGKIAIFLTLQGKSWKSWKVCSGFPETHPLPLPSSPLQHLQSLAITYILSLGLKIVIYQSDFSPKWYKMDYTHACIAMPASVSQKLFYFG